MNTQPQTISLAEWEEIIQVPKVREGWGLTNEDTAEDFAQRVYAVKFDFVSGSPGYVGDLYIIHSDVLGGMMTLIRRNGALIANVVTEL